MILVVDDDKNIRLSLKLILERNGYEVALAEEPKEAMQIVRNTPAVELVLMDMNYDSRGDRHLGYSSRHTQVPVPATTLRSSSLTKFSKAPTRSTSSTARVCSCKAYPTFLSLASSPPTTSNSPRCSRNIPTVSTTIASRYNFLMRLPTPIASPKAWPAIRMQRIC